MECRYIKGRANTAPQLRTISRSWIEHVEQQDTFGLHWFEKVSARIQWQMHPARSRTSKVSQGYLMRLESTRVTRGANGDACIFIHAKKDTKEGSQVHGKALMRWGLLRGQSWTRAHHDEMRYNPRQYKIHTSTIKNGNNNIQLLQPHSHEASGADGSYRFKLRRKAECCSSPIEGGRARRTTSDIAANEKFLKSLRGSDSYLHNHTITVSMVTICKCTGSLCPSSPASSNASGHCLSGGSETYRLCTDRRNSVIILLSKHGQPCW